ncbi:MAG: YHS domain-containing protein [Armatimonadota bacterium]|nr:YHS domain-containing protein [bacterium]
MPKDPVCGQYVPATTPYKLEIEGEIYYFCSAACAEEYENNAEDYVDEAVAEKPGVED